MRLHRISLTKEFRKVATFKAKEGSGVRHIVFSSDEKQAFVMTELTSEVIAFDYDGEGNLTNPTYYPTLPEDFSLENKGSAIKISNDNRFIYVSNRGQDAVVGLSTLATFLTSSTIPSSDSSTKYIPSLSCFVYVPIYALTIFFLLLSINLL